MTSSLADRELLFKDEVLENQVPALRAEKLDPNQEESPVKPHR